MALSIVCPKCSKTSLFADSDLRKRLKCTCGAEFFLEGVVGEKLPEQKADSATDDGALVSVVMARRLPEPPPPPPSQTAGSVPGKEQVTASSGVSDPVPIPPEQAAKELQLSSLSATGKPADAKVGDAKPATGTSVSTSPSGQQNSSTDQGSPWGWLIGVGIAGCVLVIVLLVFGRGSSQTERTSNERKTTGPGQVAKQEQSAKSAPSSRPDLARAEPVRKDVAAEPGRDKLTEQARLEKYNAAVARMNRHAEAGEWKEALAALDEASQLGVQITNPPPGFETLAVKRKVMEGLVSKLPGDTGGAMGTAVVPATQTRDKAETTLPVQTGTQSTAAEVQEATLPPYKGLCVVGVPGTVLIDCLQPGKVPNFVPVRIEVQKGILPDRFDQLVTFEVAPETAAGRTTDVTKKADSGKTEATDEKSGTTARSIRRQPASKTAKASAKDEDARAKAPGHFEDVTVREQNTYYYRARFVARLGTSGPNNSFIRDGKEVKMVVPDSVEKIKGSEEGAVLYASPWSSVEKAMVPANFQLRFLFVVGTDPADPQASKVGQSVRLGIRLWDTEARAWGESSFEVPVGQAVKGQSNFKVGVANKRREFDTGLILNAVLAANRFEIEKIREPVMETKTDENGETVKVVALDEAKRPKWVERVVSRRSPIQIVILREGQTEKLRLIKGMGYEERLPSDVRILLEGEPDPGIEQMLKGAAAAPKSR